MQHVTNSQSDDMTVFLQHQPMSNCDHMSGGAENGSFWTVYILVLVGPRAAEGHIY